MRAKTILAGSMSTGVFDRTALLGRWFVIKTSLPFWRTRSAPTITYTALDSDRWLDDVRFLNRAGQERHIVGIDTYDQAQSRRVRWRGKPWYMRWLTSEWCFVDHDPAGAEWAITYFSKTPFTAAGIDIYSRTPKLDPARIADIEARLAHHPYLAVFVPLLFAPTHG